jgi:hypothetical protein
MSNFVYNGGSLPSTKSNLNPLPGGANPANYEQATEFNTIVSAVSDIRAQILSAANICAYGADPTGAADSTAALISAYTALSSGGILYLPAAPGALTGTYKIATAGTTTVPSNVILAFESSNFNVLAGSTLVVLGPIVPPYAMPQVNVGPATPVIVRPRQFFGSALASPSTGTYVQGDEYIITAPVAGGERGYVCVTGGTPGTWKPFGPIGT